MLRPNSKAGLGDAASRREAKLEEPWSLLMTYFVHVGDGSYFHILILVKCSFMPWVGVDPATVIDRRFCGSRNIADPTTSFDYRQSTVGKAAKRSSCSVGVGR